MASWQDVATDNLLAANEAFVGSRWRTCVSRAYYAIYSAATGALVQEGMTMPGKQPNPSHKKLPLLVGHNLQGVGYSLRWRLAGLIADLYRLRLIADYQPRLSVEEPEARVALGLMDKAFLCLRGES